MIRFFNSSSRRDTLSFTFAIAWLFSSFLFSCFSFKGAYVGACVVI
jgi:hypothetical protein